MDVRKDFDEFAQIIEQQKRVLQKAKKRQGQCPHDRKPREVMLSNFMTALMVTSAKREHKEERLLHSSFIPPAYLPCIESIDNLKPITIGCLRLETHHRGTYLLVRAITPPNRMTGILVLVEDYHEDVTVLQLYQQEEECSREATDIVDKGSILLIKEPFFKVMASGEYGLRVDHLSDAIYLDKRDCRVPEAWRPRLIEMQSSAESLKLKGNTLMEQGKYWRAIKEYSNALSQSVNSCEIDVIKRNRSLAYLKIRRYDAALSDTGFPDFGDEHSEKALFRAAEALYHLTRFEECCKVLEMLRKDFPDNKQAIVVLDRARRRCAEKVSGNFDFKLLQAEAKKYRPPHLDHATYVGPVEVRRTISKGRGLFVTKPIKVGDLILCEKAFSHAYVDDTDNANASLTFLMNPETNKGFMGGQADLIRMIVQKLYNNPSMASSFTELHHGTYRAANVLYVDEQPVVDTFLIERIMSLNVFGCPVSSLNSHRDAIANVPQKPTLFHSCGIWVNASYINHNCIGNVRRSFIGDMMIVRAAKDLEADTEITFPYEAPNDSNISDMQEKFKNWDFICDCAFCENAKRSKASAAIERRKLLEKLKRLCALSQSRDIQTEKMERLLKAIDNTYTPPANELPRLLLWDPQLLLARIYLNRNDTMRGLESLNKTLESLGFIITGADCTPADFRVVRWGHVVDHLVDIFLYVRSVFEAFTAWEKSKQAEQYARIAYRVLVGEDTSFDRSYPK